MNQSPKDKKYGGGDVTKAEKVNVSPQKPTKWCGVGGHSAASKEG